MKANNSWRAIVSVTEKRCNGSDSILSASAAKRRAAAVSSTFAVRFRPVAMLLAGMWFSLFFALLPSSIAVECAQWDATGMWLLVQSGGPSLIMNLRQSGTEIKGTAVGCPSGLSGINSEVYGTLTGDAFHVRIVCDGAVSTYEGKVGPDGKIHGQFFTIKEPSGKMTWYSNSPMRCSPTPKPVFMTTKPIVSQSADPNEPNKEKYTGITKLRKTPTTPAPAAAAPEPEPQRRVIQSGKPKKAAAGAPTISYFPMNEGSAMLNWDGGKDHPYAEVWVKVDDQDETFVVEQDKGSRKVAVEPGKTYLYILTDSGQRLATVTVRAQ